MSRCSGAEQLRYQLESSHVQLPSFPTRRSSDLTPPRSSRSPSHQRGLPPGRRVAERLSPPPPLMRSAERSEEHTSELQSHSDLVCRLLLEKEKQHGGHLELAVEAELGAPVRLHS